MHNLTEELGNNKVMQSAYYTECISRSYPGHVLVYILVLLYFLVYSVSLTSSIYPKLFRYTHGIIISGFDMFMPFELCIPLLSMT
jgi:hypothetical protein